MHPNGAVGDEAEAPLPSGPVHEYIGGFLECEDTFDDVKDIIFDYVGHHTSASDLEYTMRTQAFTALKNMYRAGHLRFPLFCSMDTPFSECHAECVDLDDLEKASRKGEHYLVERYFDDMFSFGNFTAYSEYNWLAKELKAKIVKKVCEKGIGYDGDQLEAGSPIDPSFWPVHPTVERLWMHKKLKGAMGDETWPDGTGPLHRITAMYANCTGHDPEDVVPFRFSVQTINDVGATTNTSEAKLYTNRELYKIADPGSPTLPYVYGHFRWPHCALAGYDFAHLHRNLLDRVEADSRNSTASSSSSSSSSSSHGRHNSSSHGGGGVGGTHSGGHAHSHSN